MVGTSSWIVACLIGLFTMNRAKPPTFDLAALAHPAWWVALAVLLVNDNLLKGRGIVPGWLTGKLSDLAFVVLAPTLFAAILPRALPGRRAFALVSTIGLYVGADLSRAVSDGFVAAMARVGVRARLWPDVTDLVALALLPLTIHLMRRPARHEESRRRFVQQRIGVIVGAAACIATSAPLGYEHQPFLFNATAGPKTVRVTWVLGQLPCDLPETVAASLTPSDLDDPRSFDLESGQVAALDGLPATGVSPVGVCTTRSTPRYEQDTWCAGAILEADGAAPVLMVARRSWEEHDGGGFFSCQNAPSPISRCQPHLPPTSNPGPDAISLNVVDGQLRFVDVSTFAAPMLGRPGTVPPMRQNANVRIAPIDLAAVAARPPAPDGCRSLRDDYKTLITSPTCAVDLDCLGRAGVPIAGAATCEIAVNAGAAAMIEELREKWSASCQPSDAAPCTALPQPAVCRDGHCAPVCPGVALPACPRTLPASAACPLACVDPPGGGTFQGAH